MKKITFTFSLLFIAYFSHAATYYWTGGLSGDLLVDANWNTNINGSGTSRLTHSADDILIFDGTNVGGGNPTTTSTASRVKVRVTEGHTVGGLYLLNGVVLEMFALGNAPNSGAYIQYILQAGEWKVDATSVFYFTDNPNVATTHKYKLQFKSQGDIYGKIRSEGLRVIFRTLARSDINSTPLVFKHGSSFYTQSSENTFGWSSSLVTFESGSICEWYSGPGPFGSSDALVFKPGSLFVFGAYAKSDLAANFPNPENTVFGNVRIDVPEPGLTFLKDLRINGSLTIGARAKLTMDQGKNLEIINGHVILERNDQHPSFGAIKGKLALKNISAITKFPVGTANHYLPVTISPAGESSFEVSVFDGITTNALQDGALLTPEEKKRYIDAVWDIARTSGTGNATVTFEWTDNIEGVDFALYKNEGIRVAQFANNNWMSNLMGSGDASTNKASAQLSGLGTSVSHFSINNTSSVLPVHLHSFTAKPVVNTVELNWKATESNFSHYNLERSVDGKGFEVLAKINSKNESTSTYEYLDLNPFAGSNYYRLVSVDKDGTRVINPTIATAKIGKDFMFYPNPVVETLKITGLTNGDVVKIIDLQGKLMLLHSSDGNAQQFIQVGKIQTGNYVLIVENNGRIKKSAKMLKL